MNARPTIATCVLIFFQGVASAQTKPLTVCEALHVAKDHKEVVVRGAIAGGYFHGFYLAEGLDSDVCPGWPTRFLTRPAFVLLELLDHTGAPLTKQQEQLNRGFYHKLCLLEATRTLPRALTFRGVLVRKPWPIIVRYSDGSFVGNGFGEEGAVPAYLIVTSVISGL
jgi:hypothetical protein